MTRRAEHPVDPLILSRWSPLDLTGEPLPREALLSMLEAARWAPSADNSQPWRFVYVLPGSGAWPHLGHRLNMGGSLRRGA